MIAKAIIKRQKICPFEIFKNDWKIAIDAMASGKIQNDKLITHKFSLEDMDEGLDIMRNATEFYSKIIVTP